MKILASVGGLLALLTNILAPLAFLVITRLKSKVFSLERLYKFCVKKIFKQILGPKKKIWSEKILGSKKFCARKKFGLEKICIRIFFETNKISGLKIFGPNKFWVWKKKIWVQKYLGPK